MAAKKSAKKKASKRERLQKTLKKMDPSDRQSALFNSDVSITRSSTDKGLARGIKSVAGSPGSFTTKPGGRVKHNRHNPSAKAKVQRNMDSRDASTAMIKKLNRAQEERRKSKAAWQKAIRGEQ